MHETRPHRTVIVLAAGKGTRMKSPHAKVLHPLMGRPMLVHLLDQLRTLHADDTLVVVGHQREAVEALLPPFGARAIVQEPQSGTGHAFMCCRPALEERPPGEVLLVPGDAPLIPAEEIGHGWDEFTRTGAKAAVVTLELEDPEGYGRVLESSNGSVKRIVEEKDATEAQKQITTVNSGVYFFKLPDVLPLLDRLTQNNAQGEFYLPDLFDLLYRQGEGARAFQVSDPDEWLGANSQLDLAFLISHLRNHIAAEWMEAGVTMLDPETVWIEPTVELEPGAVLHSGVRLCGKTRVAAGAEIRSYSILHDTDVAEKARVFEHCVLEATRVGPRCKIGPFCHTRPGTVLEEEVHLGNFVETKKSVLHRGVKANHLAYLGDATVGAESNIGAGTITCNYDGVNKNPTVFGEKVFIGSDTQLVAPVTIGDGAYVGAGTTVTKDVPPGALAVSRVDQKNIEGWVEKKKKKDAERGRGGDAEKR
jgi:bifunctional UDP-N-acetylglucosamine pyrophosphorylase / glucosamine-1-phosphate N-acetyltransferase